MGCLSMLCFRVVVVLTSNPWFTDTYERFPCSEVTAPFVLRGEMRVAMQPVARFFFTTAYISLCVLCVLFATGVFRAHLLQRHV